MFRWKFPSLLILLFSIIVWFGLGFFGGNVLSMIRTVEDEVIINQTTNKTMGAVVSLIWGVKMSKKQKNQIIIYIIWGMLTIAVIILLYGIISKTILKWTYTNKF